jgi:AcrR family transcriptional regulator
VRDAKILAATRDILLSAGYRDLTVDAVAGAAGVTRGTVYRRYPTKVALVIAAVFPPAEESVFALTGDLAADLTAHATRAIAAYSDPVVAAAIPGLIADTRTDPAAHAEVLSAHQARLARQFQDILADQAKDGTARAGLDAGIVLDALFGAIERRMIEMAPMDEEFARKLVDLLMNGISGASTDLTNKMYDKSDDGSLFPKETDPSEAL